MCTCTLYQNTPRVSCGDTLDRPCGQTVWTDTNAWRCAGVPAELLVPLLFAAPLKLLLLLLLLLLN